MFYSIWGYDQTNYDYFVVIGISPSGKTALIQRAKFKDLGSSGQCNIQKPTSEGYGKVFRVKIEQNNRDNEINLRGSVPFCDQSDDSLRLSSLWLAKGEQVFYETDTMFGH